MYSTFSHSNSSVLCLICDTCSPQKPEFVDDHVQPNKEYEYKITAVNEGGESDPSEISNPIKAKALRGKFLNGLRYT